MDASSIALIGTGLTLIVTIAGWIITYRLQRQILERQLIAERERDAKQILVPRRLERLRDLRDWFQEGMKLTMRAIHDKSDDVSKEYDKWEQRGPDLIVFAASIEGKSFRDAIGQEDSLAGMSDTFVKVVRESTHLRTLSDKVNVYEKVQKRIDALEEQTAKSD